MILDHLQKSWSDPKDSGGQGFKGSSEMLKNDKAADSSCTQVDR